MLIKSDHFAGKLRFITDFEGLALLSTLLLEEATPRFRRKQLSLLQDLVMYDDFIVPHDKQFVRKFCCDQTALITKLVDIIVESDLDKSQEL